MVVPDRWVRRRVPEVVTKRAMITVAWKWTGATSHADRTALEVALRLAGASVPVTVLTVGPPGGRGGAP